jgi:GT2 family glycosyltransferase
VDVTIAVSTFGSDWWQELACHRAVPSARKQGVPVVCCHADTLQDARNGSLDQVKTEWIIYLDADDELEPGYVETMLSRTADLRAPMVRYMHNGAGAMPRMPNVWGHTHQCVGECLPFGNWMVIGTMVRADMLRKVGGWHDYPWSEDWDMWLRCYLAGATVEAVPEAIYRAHVNPNSRNRSMSHAGRLETHRAIAAANGVPIP